MRTHPITNREQLLSVIRSLPAHSNSQDRWYITRLAKAMGVENELPPDWRDDAGKITSFRKYSEEKMATLDNMRDLAQRVGDAVDSATAETTPAELETLAASAAVQAMRVGAHPEFVEMCSEVLQSLVTADRLYQEDADALVASLRTVRTSAGEAFFGLPMGSPIGGGKGNVNPVEKVRRVVELPRHAVEAPRRVVDAPRRAVDIPMRAVRARDLVPGHELLDRHGGLHEITRVGKGPGDKFTIEHHKKGMPSQSTVSHLSGKSGVAVHNPKSASDDKVEGSVGYMQTGGTKGSYGEGRDETSTKIKGAHVSDESKNTTESEKGAKTAAKVKESTPYPKNNEVQITPKARQSEAQAANNEVKAQNAETKDVLKGQQKPVDENLTPEERATIAHTQHEGQVVAASAFRRGGQRPLANGRINYAAGKNDPERFTPKSSLADGHAQQVGDPVRNTEGRTGTISKTYQAHSAVDWHDGGRSMTVHNSKLNYAGDLSTVPHSGDNESEDLKSKK